MLKLINMGALQKLSLGYFTACVQAYTFFKSSYLTGSQNFLKRLLVSSQLSACLSLRIELGSHGMDSH
jgi:hypothetical protein